MLNSTVIPKTKGGVGEVWRAVEVSDSKAAADVIHGGHRHVPSLHEPSLNGALIGAITKSNQAIIVIQTGGYKHSKIQFTNFLPIKAHINLHHNVYFIIIQ